MSSMKRLLESLELTKKDLAYARKEIENLRKDIQRNETQKLQDIDSVIKVLGISGYEDTTEPYMEAVFNFVTGRYDNMVRTQTNYGANKFLMDIREAAKAVEGKAALKRIKAALNG